MLKSEKDDRIILLSGGKPHESLFPLGSKLTFTLNPVVSCFEFLSATDHQSKENGKKQKHREHNGSTPRQVTVDINAEAMLNYNQRSYSRGLPSLISLCEEIILKPEHSLPESCWNNYSTCVTNGSTDGISKCVTLLTNENDVILCSEYTYPGIIAASNPLKRLVCPVEMDEFGINAQALQRCCEEILQQGEANGRQLRPKLLYIIPNGQNPTGVTIPTERRQELYKVCVQYDMLLMVDDPYFFLSLGKGELTGSSEPEMEPLKDNSGKTNDQLSFLEIEAEFMNGEASSNESQPGLLARVLRLDSFSKTIAPGFRLGLLTGPTEIVDKYAIYAQITSWGLGGPNQAILEALLRDMGREGFVRHIKSLQEEYRKRRDALVAELSQHVPKELASFQTPTHGMFIWLTVNLKSIHDTGPVFEKLLENFVSLMPGNIFSATGSASKAFRVSFSYSTHEAFRSSAKKIGDTLKVLQKKGEEKFSTCDAAQHMNGTKKTTRELVQAFVA